MKRKKKLISFKGFQLEAPKSRQHFLPGGGGNINYFACLYIYIYLLWRGVGRGRKEVLQDQHKGERKRGGPQVRVRVRVRVRVLCGPIACHSIYINLVDVPLAAKPAKRGRLRGVWAWLRGCVKSNLISSKAPEEAASAASAALAAEKSKRVNRIEGRLSISQEWAGKCQGRAGEALRRSEEVHRKSAKGLF